MSPTPPPAPPPASGRSHYEVLGVDRSATTDEIKQAWRQRVLEAHPDTAADAAAASRASQELAELKSAVAVLADAGARAAYDRTLRPANAGGACGAPVAAARGGVPAPFGGDHDVHRYRRVLRETRPTATHDADELRRRLQERRRPLLSAPAAASRAVVGPWALLAGAAVAVALVTMGASSRPSARRRG